MRILVTGSASGLGQAIALTLESRRHKVVRYDLLDGGYDVLQPIIDDEQLDVLINCAGVTRLDYCEDVSVSLDWDYVMDTNAKGILMMTQACLPKLKQSSNGTILNIISDAARRPMTASLAYNASKAAAHIMTLQLARELYPRHGIIVFGIAPGKLSRTRMSKYVDRRVLEIRGWTEEYAQERQLAALPLGEEAPPEALAKFISYLFSHSENYRYFHGCVIPWGCALE